MTENGKTFCDSCNTMENVEHYESIGWDDVHKEYDLCPECAKQMVWLVCKVRKDDEE